MLMKRRRIRRGSTVVEYALFLALIAGALIFAGDAVSYAMRDSLLQASARMQTEVAPRHLPVESLSTEDDLLATLVSPGGGDHVQTYQVAAVASVLFFGAVVWYALYCRRVKPKSNADALTAELNELPPEISHDEIFAKRQQILRILSSDMKSLLESRLEVRHLMSRKLLVVAPETSLEEVRETMESHKLRHLLVCDGGGYLRGIISDRDLASRHGKTAGQIMTTNPITLEPQAQVNPAITLLINKKISCLPVVQDGAPIGVLTSTDMMMALQCSMQVLQKVAHEIIKPTESLRQAAGFSSNGKAQPTSLPA